MSFFQKSGRHIEYIKQIIADDTCDEDKSIDAPFIKISSIGAMLQRKGYM